MAWTALTFAYGSILTSTKMTQLYNNVTSTQDVQVFTASGTWAKPSWVTANMVFEVEVWGGGGGGAQFTGGGGGAYNCRRFLASELGSTESVTVAGTAAASTVGNTSSFGTTPKLYAYGGGSGAGGTKGGGGGGCRGAGASGATGVGGIGYTSKAGAAANANGTSDGGGGGAGISTNAGCSFCGGGGGGYDTSSNGGDSIYGGGGGAATGGASLFGGGGGNGGVAGSSPAGGGGTAYGTGARGEVRVRLLA